RSSDLLDLGDAGVGSQRIGDTDADAIGSGGGEVDGTLDQVVAADGAESDPGSAIPALHGEVGDAVEAEGHAVGRLDRTGVVVLDRVDDDVIDGLAAVEVDLDPVRIGIGGSVDPAAAITPRSEEHTSELQSRGHLV